MELDTVKRCASYAYYRLRGFTWCAAILHSSFSWRSASFAIKYERGTHCLVYPSSSTPAGGRTLDTLIKSQVLYQLSYKRISLLFCECKGTSFILFRQTFRLLSSKYASRLPYYHMITICAKGKARTLRLLQAD